MKSFFSQFAASLFGAFLALIIYAGINFPEKAPREKNELRETQNSLDLMLNATPFHSAERPETTSLERPLSPMQSEITSKDKTDASIKFAAIDKRSPGDPEVTSNVISSDLIVSAEVGAYSLGIPLKPGNETVNFGDPMISADVD